MSDRPELETWLRTSLSTAFADVGAVRPATVEQLERRAAARGRTRRRRQILAGAAGLLLAGSGTAAAATGALDPVARAFGAVGAGKDGEPPVPDGYRAVGDGVMLGGGYVRLWVPGTSESVSQGRSRCAYVQALDTGHRHQGGVAFCGEPAPGASAQRVLGAVVGGVSDPRVVEVRVSAAGLPTATATVRGAYFLLPRDLSAAPRLAVQGRDAAGHILGRWTVTPPPGP
jgi:hypothetical protein